MEWDWTDLSCNPAITLKIIRENPDWDWDWFAVSCNPNITLKDILENPDMDWDWSGVSRNPNITFKDIQENPNMDWDWYTMSWCKFGEEPSRLRTVERTQTCKEELMQTAWSPARLGKMLEKGYSLEDIEQRDKGRCAEEW